jgi:transglutaminase-like putative cysteine protease
MMEKYLRPTYFLDHDHPSVKEFAAANSAEHDSPKDKASALYYAVRDGFQYDPYKLDLRPEGLRASTLLTRTRGYCVEKAVLLAASWRAVGIPSRLSFYIVRNHIATDRLEKILGTDQLVFHGAAEAMLDGEWRKATPAFNRQLCDVLGVDPLVFDGTGDSIFQQFNRSGGKFMEYLHEYGAFEDMPYEVYLAGLRHHYAELFESGRYRAAEFIYDFRRDDLNTTTI